MGKTTIACHLAFAAREAGPAGAPGRPRHPGHRLDDPDPRHHHRAAAAAAPSCCSATRSRSTRWRRRSGSTCCTGISTSTELDRDFDIDRAPAVLDALRTLPYDVVVIDTPPALGPRHLSPLFWSDFALTPLEPTSASMQGLAQTTESSEPRPADEPEDRQPRDHQPPHPPLLLAAREHRAARRAGAPDASPSSPSGSPWATPSTPACPSGASGALRRTSARRGGPSVESSSVMSQPTHSASSLDGPPARPATSAACASPSCPSTRSSPIPTSRGPSWRRTSSTPDVQKELEGLADNIRAIGVVQPIRVRPKPEGDGYCIVAGERRWRAARLAGLETIPAIVDLQKGQGDVAAARPDLREPAARRTCACSTSPTASTGCATAPTSTTRELATMLGRSKAWFSHHIRALRARGLPLEALEDNLLQSAETLRLFQKLPEAQQQRLLNAARDAKAPIPRSQVRSLMKRRKNAKEAAAARKGPKLYGLRLSADELRRLIAALGSEAPEDDQELVEALRGLLNPAEAGP